MTNSATVFLRLFCGMIFAIAGMFGGVSTFAQQPSQDSSIRVASSQQALLDRPTTINVTAVSRKQAIDAAARSANVLIQYREQVLDGYRDDITLQATNTPLRQVLDRILAGTSLRVVLDGTSKLMIVESSAQNGKPGATQATGTIVGRVTDSASGRGIGKVTVTVQGTSLSTLTQDNGHYSIGGVPIGKHFLLARIVGYTSARIPVAVNKADTTTVNIILNGSATVLSDVVTTATGAQRKVEIPNDIVKIDADKIRERAPVRSVVDLLEAAQVPGVLVTRAGGDPGAASRIRIRGIGSISQSNDPVVIVDGIWIDAATSTPSRLDDIDPETIETVEIIRGPSASTLFGADAANGVIVIKTKKGKAGPARWDVSYKRDWGQTYGRLPLVYTGIGHTSSRVDPVVCSIQKVINFDCIQDSVLISDPNHDLLSREGTETNNRYVLQMDGGTRNITYSVMLSTGNIIGVRRIAGIDLIRDRIFGYQPESRFLKPSSLRRDNITTGLNFVPRGDLTMSLTFTNVQTNLKDNRLNHAWTGLYGPRPIAYDVDTLFRASGEGRITRNEDPKKTTSNTIASSLQYRPGHIVTINGNAGIERRTMLSSRIQYPITCSIQTGCTDEEGNRSEDVTNGLVYSVRLNASTTLPLGALGRFLEIRPSFGGDYKMTDQYGVSVTRTRISPGDRSFSSGTLTNSNATSIQNALAGWFINSTVGVFQRIYFDVGVRQDIGSAITSSKDATYPKIGGSWLISNESFWRENPIVNSLRLRSAIGHAAVQPSVSDIDGKFLTGVEYIDGKFVRTTDLSLLGNSQLRPERSVEFEMGFDLDMLNSRLNLIGTYAHKENRNTLVVRTLPSSFGTAKTGTRKENIAKVQNRNFELSATARAVETHRTLLIFNYALTLSDNKVMRLGNGITPFGTNLTGRIAAGYPLGSVWNRKVFGYRDVNGDGLLSKEEVILSDSLVYVGWSQPRYRASYGVSLTLNNQLVIDSRFASQSNYVQNFTPGIQYGAEDVNAPMQDQASSVIPEINGARPVSDFRWNSASITYHLPSGILGRLRSRRISVSLQGSELGLWTNYIGRDPAVNSSVLGDVSYDNGGRPPRPRRYVLDVKVGF